MHAQLVQCHISLHSCTATVGERRYDMKRTSLRQPLHDRNGLTKYSIFTAMTCSATKQYHFGGRIDRSDIQSFMMDSPIDKQQIGEYTNSLLYTQLLNSGRFNHATKLSLPLRQRLICISKL